MSGGPGLAGRRPRTSRSGWSSGPLSSSSSAVRAPRTSQAPLGRHGLGLEDELDLAKGQEWGVSRIEAAAKAERGEGACRSQRALTPPPEPSIPVKANSFQMHVHTTQAGTQPSRLGVEVWSTQPAPCLPGLTVPAEATGISRSPLPSLSQLAHYYAQLQATPVTFCLRRQRSLERCCVQLTQLSMEALRSALSQLLRQTLVKEPLARRHGHSRHCPQPPDMTR